MEVVIVEFSKKWRARSERRCMKSKRERSHLSAHEARSKVLRKLPLPADVTSSHDWIRWTVLRAKIRFGVLGHGSFCSVEISFTGGHNYECRDVAALESSENMHNSTGSSYLSLALFFMEKSQNVLGLSRGTDEDERSAYR